MGVTELRYCVEFFDLTLTLTLLVSRCSNTIHPTTPGPRLERCRLHATCTPLLLSVAMVCVKVLNLMLLGDEKSYHRSAAVFLASQDALEVMLVTYNTD